MSKIHSTSLLSTPWPFLTGILSHVSKNDDEKTLLLKVIWPQSKQFIRILNIFFFLSIKFVKKLEENNQENESSHLQKLEHLKESFGERLLKSQTDFEASVQKVKEIQI